MIDGEKRIVGARPWLPWPFSAWRSWTDPVRAERLAALRIGLAFFLLLDVLTSFFPYVNDFYGPDSLTRFGDHDVFRYYAQAPRWNWSILRGLGHPTNLILILPVAVALTCWVMAVLLARVRDPEPGKRASGLIVGWTILATIAVLGFWGRLDTLAEPERGTALGPGCLIAAGILWLLGGLAAGLDLWARRQSKEGGGPSAVTALSWLWASGVLFWAAWYWLFGDWPIAGLSLRRLCGPWDNDAAALWLFMIALVIALLFMLIGFGTRWAVAVVWVLTLSFDNLNPYLENNGDTARCILMLYLVLTPCGAAWSLDDCRRRRRTGDLRPAFVHPWPLRLLFLQMILLYFFNGVFKLFGSDWLDGESLHYVLANPTWSRISYLEYHPPLWVLQIATYVVLFWEAGFPPGYLGLHGVGVLLRLYAVHVPSAGALGTLEQARKPCEGRFPIGPERMRLIVARIVSIFLTAACWAFLAPAQPPPGPRPDRLDRSISRALGFLQTMQESDGSWRSGPEKNPAVTALAVMAFLSAGHVPGEGPYGLTVEKGIRWVLGKQSANGLIAGDGSLEMYHHGIATLMLAEVAGMTDAPLGREVKSALEKAVDVILKAQRMSPNHHKGGWRYQARGADADISVTGWQLLALRAAKNLGCDVPAERIDLALEYVHRCRDPVSGGFCYMPGGRVTVACTGTSILALEICGPEHHSREALQAGSHLLKQALRFGGEYFFYSVYYSTQAMFQLGHNYWNFFRPQLHKVLLDQQNPNGSWIGGEGFGASYGTAMSVLALTVEYRFLPIYQRGEEPPGQ
jgi:hypothetical protein